MFPALNRLKALYFLIRAQVYNWTDGPIILSGSSLLLLDPHETWSREVSQPGGPMYDFVESCNEPEMINQLVPFRPIVENISQPFDGTVIRIPLRTASQALTTKILDLERNPTKVADLKSVFEKFATEMAESLLFLRHITSITLKIGDEDYAQAIARKYDGETDITESFSLDEPFNSVLVNGDQSTREESYKMDVHFTIGGEKQLQQYAVTHHFRDKGDDFELNSWARKYKLMPWVAIASPLQLVGKQ